MYQAGEIEKEFLEEQGAFVCDSDEEYNQFISVVNSQENE